MNRRAFIQMVFALWLGGRTGALWAASGERSSFHLIYDSPRQRAEFLRFLQNVFRLYPEDDFHRLIGELTARFKTDREIYEELVRRLPEIRPLLGDFTYALPSLRKQKEEMTRQSLALLGSAHSPEGYLEIGTPGRYVGGIRSALGVRGSVYLLNDQKPGYSPADIMERGQLTPVGDFVAMGNYDPFGEKVPERSVELVTCFIGLHHAPAERLDAFVRSIWKALRPGGKLLIRDHDVDGPEMEAMVALAHDVYNAGTGIPWTENHDQVRNFRSISKLQDYLSRQGFRRQGTALRQDGDPTRNTLLAFAKPTGALPPT